MLLCRVYFYFLAYHFPFFHLIASANLKITNSCHRPSWFSVWRLLFLFAGLVFSPLSSFIAAFLFLARVLLALSSLALAQLDLLISAIVILTHHTANVLCCKAHTCNRVRRPYKSSWQPIRSVA